LHKLVITAQDPKSLLTYFGVKSLARPKRDVDGWVKIKIKFNPTDSKQNSRKNRRMLRYQLTVYYTLKKPTPLW
jgi:hypothetical protein